MNFEKFITGILITAVVLEWAIIIIYQIGG